MSQLFGRVDIRRAGRQLSILQLQITLPLHRRELLETCPIYYDIAASQLSEEELA